MRSPKKVKKRVDFNVSVVVPRARALQRYAAGLR